MINALIGDDDRETLITAAVESLFDPHKVILEEHAIGIDFAKEKLMGPFHKHFLLEHIVSGAMAASVPARATRHAFARDKKTGVAKGVTVDDVLKSVNDLFEENRRLEHEFALAEFREQFLNEAKVKHDQANAA